MKLSVIEYFLSVIVSSARSQRSLSDNQYDFIECFFNRKKGKGYRLMLSLLKYDRVNDHCAMSVYNALNENNAAWSMLAGFMGENPEASLKFDVVSNLICNNSSSAVACTSYNTNSGEITIKFDQSYLSKASSISVARTFLHELIHAELYRKVHSGDLLI